MPRRPTLGPGTIKAIQDLVEELFDKVRARFLGPRILGGKRIAITFNPELTLPGVYGASAMEERVRPDSQTMHGLAKVADGYLQAVKEKTKAQVVKAVDSFLQQAHAQGIKTDVKTVLGGELSKVFGKVTSDVERIVDTELTTARNMGALDGIVKFNASQGIDDPVVYFVTVRDQHLCEECKRLHLLEDGVTPRVWLLSEVGHNYHKRGEGNPKVGGLHPHCRCSMVTIMQNYGFKNGGVAYIGRDHDEFKRQRGL